MTERSILADGAEHAGQVVGSTLVVVLAIALIVLGAGRLRRVPPPGYPPQPGQPRRGSAIAMIVIGAVLLLGSLSAAAQGLQSA